MRPTDEQILIAMRARPAGIFTYVIKNILELEHGCLGITTASVRRRLLRLEATGIVASKNWGPGCHTEWRVVGGAA